MRIYIVTGVQRQIREYYEFYQTGCPNFGQVPKAAICHFFLRVLYAVGANAAHGMRRTNEDKRRAVETLLNDAEWVKWSDREIARRCAVSNDFVSRLRPSICHSMTDTLAERLVERGGTIYTQNTLTF